MVLKKEELVLYALSMLEGDDRPNVKYSKENLAYALDISESTLDLYFTKLKNMKLIERNKKKYYQDLRETVKTTKDGKNRVKDIHKRIETEILTPDRHSIPSIVKVSTIINRIDSILEKIFFLSLYSSMIRFDLPLYLETLRTAKQESNIVKALGDIGETEVQEEVPMVEMFFKTSFYGDIDVERFSKDSSVGSNVNGLLIVAEASIKQGRYKEARTIYDYILSPTAKKNQNQWFMAKVGLALLISKLGDFEKALDQLNDLSEKSDNKIQKAYCTQLSARILSENGKYDEAMKLFNTSIRSFKAKGIPVLLGTSHNNRGILYFRMENYDEAEKDWKKAKRYAGQCKSKYLEGIINGNLADIEMLKGNFDQSLKYLKLSYELFDYIGDYECKAYIFFNYALYHIERKEFIKALEMFNKAMEMAYPYPSPAARKEMKNVLIERGLKNGFTTDEIEKNITVYDITS